MAMSMKTTMVTVVMNRGGTQVVPPVVDHRAEVVPADLGVGVAEVDVAVADLAVDQEGDNSLLVFIF